MIRRRSVLYAATGTVVVLAATTTAATYALYSDFDTATGGSATAATVALGSEDAEPPSLTYPPMQLVGCNCARRCTRCGVDGGCARWRGSR